jgi:hypothetical protein
LSTNTPPKYSFFKKHDLFFYFLMTVGKLLSTYALLSLKRHREGPDVLIDLLAIYWVRSREPWYQKVGWAERRDTLLRGTLQCHFIIFIKISF